jgi:hypothetical protein
MIHKLPSSNGQKNSHIINTKNHDHELLNREIHITSTSNLIPVHGRRVVAYGQHIDEVILTDGMSRAFF